MKRFLLLTLCLAMLALLFGCDAPSKAETEEAAPSTVQEMTEETTEETQPEILWEKPALGEEVTLLFDETLDNEDGEAQTYQVPLLNCKGGDSEIVNQEITDTYTPIMERVRSGKARDITGISYKVERFRIYTVSLLICCSYADGGNSYTAYTLSLNSGHLMSSRDLLQELNISEESFLAEVKTRACEVFEELHEDDEHNAAYQKQLDAFCSDDNINLDMPMLTDTGGHLLLISPIGANGRQVMYYLQKEFEE